jgi:hypothetical protein
LATGIEAKFEMAETAKALRSLGSSEAQAQLMADEAKELRKEKREYESYRRQFTGVIMSSLGAAMEHQVRVHAKFGVSYSENNILVLWNIIKGICTKDVVEDLDEAKYHLWNVRQGNRSFDEYVLDIEQKLRVLTDGKVEFTQPDLVNIFIMGLNPKIFKDKISDIKAHRNLPEYPSDFLSVKEVFRVWYQIRARASDFEVSVGAVSESKTVKCWKCQGSHYRSQCPQMVGKDQGQDPKTKKWMREEKAAALSFADYEYVIG